VAPQRLEDHYTPRRYQKPLEKKDFLTPRKTKVFRGDGREDYEEWQEDDGPLKPVDEASMPGREIVRTIYQVVGWGHFTINHK
jgi:hypothetical protein